jgi:hypothetical protein
MRFSWRTTMPSLWSMNKRWIRLGVVLPLTAILAACTPKGDGATRVTRNSSASKQATLSGPVACLDQQLRAPPPRGGWLPDRGGILDYNPDSTGSELDPSAQAGRMAASFATVIGKGFEVAKIGENGTSSCALVRWVLLRDQAGSSVYLALFQLRDPVNSGSFPLLGTTTDRRHLDDGTVVLASQTEDQGVVTVVEARVHGLVALIQVRRANDAEGEGYPTTVMVPPSGSTSTGPAPLTVDQAISAATNMLSKSPAT